jgi:hypothetical protein
MASLSSISDFTCLLSSRHYPAQQCSTGLKEGFLLREIMSLIWQYVNIEWSALFLKKPSDGKGAYYNRLEQTPSRHRGAVVYFVKWNNVDSPIKRVIVIKDNLA